MSTPRFSVIPGVGFHDQLACEWLKDHRVTHALNRLDMVLRTMGDQVGKSFLHQGRTYRYVRYRGYQLTYEVLPDDCIVRLHDIRQFPGADG